MADKRLEQYVEAMEIDPVTNKPMSKVAFNSGQYVRKSTDPKPTGKEGDSLYLWDTKESFINDGIDWRAL
ncbi:MAG: hypothetical protein HF308_14380 [Ignavibacteria bacterium]|jgi:hypothetical protein|nr:hypothetical protein [Ignavibacteria bacterium]